MKKGVQHVGFKAAVEKARAGGANNPAAAVAAAARNASPAAVARNPRLLRVKRGERRRQIAAIRAKG